MTLPQDTRSPARQQRWIEFENVGPTVIPAYGAVQIVGSYRPEIGSGYTPGDGRTVLQVQLANQDNPCSHAINGHCDIPPYESRRVGTVDDPMLALVASLYYPAGTGVGIKAGSYLLHEGYCGYVVAGDPDAGTNTLRVLRYDNCATEHVVKAYECIYPGRGGYVKVQRWNSSKECWEDDPNLAPIRIHDPMGWILAVEGECFPVRSENCSQQAWRPAMPYGLHRLVKAKSEIKCNTCGRVTILKYDKTAGSDSECRSRYAETTCEVTACNIGFRKISCDVDEYAWLDILPGECCPDYDEEQCVGILTPFQRPIVVSGKAKEKSCGAAIKLDEAKYADAPCWGTPPDTLGNDMNLHVCAGDWAFGLWDDEECAYKAVNVADVELPDWMLDVRCKPESCSVEKKQKVHPYMGHYCECDNDEDEWVLTSMEGERFEMIVGVETTETAPGIAVMTDLACNPCKMVKSYYGLGEQSLIFKTKSFCLFCADPKAGDDIIGPDVAYIGSVQDDRFIYGTELEVITGIGVEWVGATGSGTDECPTEAGTLRLTGATKKVCLFCSAAGDGTFEDGTPVTLPVTFGEVEAATYIDFDCSSGCPSLAWDKRTFWALCVGGEDVGGVSACECYVCPPASSASATPSGA